jgi:hypothetical protein
MKKLILIICLLQIAFINTLLAQEYVPMPTSNAIWSEYDIWWGGYIPEISPYYMVITGDTIINNNTYHKIVQSLDTIIDMTTDCFRGSFREDTNKSVYFLPKDSINEVLIYDFSKNVGDTIYINEFDWTVYISTPYIIDQIDSILIDGNYRRKFIFIPLNGFYTQIPWVEGIGSMVGILNSFNPHSISGWWSFNCLTQNGNHIYQNPESYVSDCFVFLDIAIQNAYGENISISPNPSKGIFQISFEKFNSLTVKVYSVKGKILFEKKLNGTNYIIDLSNFNSGLYLVKITDTETKHSIQKKIIIKK